MKAIIKLKFTDDLLIKSLTHVAEYIMRGAYDAPYNPSKRRGESWRVYADADALFLSFDTRTGRYGALESAFDCLQDLMPFFIEEGEVVEYATSDQSMKWYEFNDCEGKSQSIIAFHEREDCKIRADWEKLTTFLYRAALDEMLMH